MVKAVRGAVSVDKNDHPAMEKAVFELMKTISTKNKLIEEDIISIVFSQTSDLNVANPAAALRKSGTFSAVPLFCTKEPEYEGSLASVLRVLVTYQTEEGRKPLPVYLGKAATLRADLVVDYDN